MKYLAPFIIEKYLIAQSNLSSPGMFNYNYKGRYFADFTFRMEGSSLFAPDVRFGDFWSVGGDWNISEESFIKNI